MATSRGVVGNRRPYRSVLSTRERAEGSKGKIGIALSGGGIRSASYNLGALQVLEDEGILDEAALISAVSGGAYIASAYAVASAEAERAAEQETRGEKSSLSVTGASHRKSPVFGRGSPEEEFLRNHSSYIAPTALSKLRAVSIWFRGLVLNLLVLGFCVLVAGALLGWFFEWIHPSLSATDPRASGGIHRHWIIVLGTGATLGLGFLLFAADAILDLTARGNPSLRKVSSRLLAAGVITGLILGIPYLLVWMRTAVDDPDGLLTAVRGLLNVKQQPELTNPGAFDGGLVGIAQLVMVVNVVAAGIRFMLARKRSIYVLIVAAATGPVLVLLPFLMIVNNAAGRGPSVGIPLVQFTGESTVATMLFAATLVLLATTFNCNKTSLHYFYTSRLSSAFTLHRTTPDEAEPIVDHPVKLSDYQPAHGPQFIYCAAANTLGDGSAPPGRNAVPFVFSAEDCGGKTTGWLPARRLEECMGGLTLPAAVAISGAAVSPTMGRQTRRLYTFLMGLLNARLGVWVPNPKFVRENEEGGDLPDTLRSRLAQFSVRHSRRWPRSGVRYLVYEFLGWHRLDRRFIYVTDGGHYDNLGVVELLRRGCTTIFSFDASGDKVDTFNTLGESISMARTDQLVEVEIEPEALIPEKNSGLAERTHVIGTYRFAGDEETAPTEGELVFVKATVTKESPWDIRAFSKKDPSFPNHSTIDQLFTDQKFESYRALGAVAAREAIAGLTLFRERKEQLRIVESRESAHRNGESDSKKEVRLGNRNESRVPER